jgi:hypothetical protein
MRARACGSGDGTRNRRETNNSVGERRLSIALVWLVHLQPLSVSIHSFSSSSSPSCRASTLLPCLSGPPPIGGLHVPSAQKENLTHSLCTSVFAAAAAAAALLACKPNSLCLGAY